MEGPPTEEEEEDSKTSINIHKTMQKCTLSAHNGIALYPGNQDYREDYREDYVTHCVSCCKLFPFPSFGVNRGIAYQPTKL